VHADHGSSMTSKPAAPTPSDVHHGYVPQRLEQRQRTMDVENTAHPERFVRGKLTVRQAPTARSLTVLWRIAPMPRDTIIEHQF